jgi:hypothetical protein
MSCRTRTHFRVRTTDQRALSLDGILGQGGRELMLQTMRSLTGGTHGLKMAETAAAQLAWQRVTQGPRQTDTYRLTLTGQHLSEPLRAQGVEQLQVDLGLGPTLTTVTHQVTATGTSPSLSEVVQQEAERLANLSVNRVLAVAVAQQLSQRVAQYVQQPVNQQPVQLRVSQTCDMRAYAFVRG